MNILICSNPMRDVGGESAKISARILERLGANVSRCVMTDVGAQSRGGYELLIVLGGDGTILRSAPYAAMCGASVLGINLGSVGNLSAFGRDDIETGLELAVKGDYVTENRMLLDISGRLAVNEAVIYRGLNPRPIRLRAEITTEKDKCLRSVKGDGLILATPTGSTAYSMCAGGAVIDVLSEKFLFTPICSVSSKPENFANVCEIAVTLDGEGYAALSIDGQEPSGLNVGDTVIIKRAEQQLKLIKMPKSNVM